MTHLSISNSVNARTMNYFSAEVAERETRPTKTRISRVATILTVAAGCACFIGCSSGADSKQQKAQAAVSRTVSVATAQVQRQDVPVYLTGLGAVTAFNTANIKSRVDGQIMRVNFQEGQNVKEGDLLIEIDARPYQVQLEQMQAQLFRDQAQLREREARQLSQAAKASRATHVVVNDGTLEALREQLAAVLEQVGR